MLQTISWQEYLTGLAILLTLYYIGTAGWLFAANIKNRLTNRERPSEEPPLSDTSDSPVGTAQPENHRVETLHAEDVYTVLDEDERRLQLGSVSDLLEEIKTIAETASKSKADSGQTVALVKSILLRYPQLAQSAYREPINISLHHTLSGIGIEYSVDLINSWWPISTNT